MIQRIRELEAEITRMKTWDTEKQRYQWISPWPGCLVYAVKASMKGVEPPHCICQQCYEEGRKSILQDAEKHDRRGLYMIKCFHCSLEVERHHGPESEQKYV